MPSEPKDFTKPSRNGRMTGVNITIDGDTWQYVLENAGIPIETPLSEIKIKRYRTRDGRIILKVLKCPSEPVKTLESASVGANMPHADKTAQMPVINDSVLQTPIQPYETQANGIIFCQNHHTIYCNHNNECDLYGKYPYYRNGKPDGYF